MLMEVRHVSKRYGKKTALADVSLKLEKGKHSLVENEKTSR